MTPSSIFCRIVLMTRIFGQFTYKKTPSLRGMGWLCHELFKTRLCKAASLAAAVTSLSHHCHELSKFISIRRSSPSKICSNSSIKNRSTVWHFIRQKTELKTAGKSIRNFTLFVNYRLHSHR